MTRESLTLANMVLRETYRPRSVLARLTKRPLGDIRAALIRARRFVLDDEMAAFVADLSTVPFRADLARGPEVLDAIRHGARLPFPTTWVEWSGRAFRRRMLELDPTAHAPGGGHLPSPDEVPPVWGYLLEEHLRLPEAVRMTEFVALDDSKVVTPPFQWAWQTTDNPLPWSADSFAGMLAHGVIGYQCPQIGVLYEAEPRAGRDGCIVAEYKGRRHTIHTMVHELAGTPRYAMSLLATLNDVPSEVREVAADRGFAARGSYRRYLDHSVVRLTVPARVDRQRLAKRLVVAARRRAHEVRGHWRLYQRGEGVLCDARAHAWGAADEGGHARCTRCPAWRTWIPPHQRGDASLALVVHDYAVSHGRA